MAIVMKQVMKQRKLGISWLSIGSFASFGLNVYNILQHFVNVSMSLLIPGQYITFLAFTFIFSASPSAACE